MTKLKLAILSIFIFCFISCSKDEVKIAKIKKKIQELEMITVYNDAYKKLEINDTYNAAQKFLEAELLFPQSIWAPKSSLMASYSYYLQNYYSEALSNLDRYLKTYPKDKNLPYAHYLIAMCHYEMIEDEKRDTEPLVNARKKFNYILKNYPNTDFALDARFKLDLIQDILASKEMYLGRHYQKKNKWIAAINRFKNVVEQYDKTIFIEEALHRLVEINYKIGLVEESQKYATLLGYNYLSSDWYKRSYKVFNANYKEEKPKKILKNKKSVIDRFKTLFD
jgi:outer membrane protein assembly factor BamD